MKTEVFAWLLVGAAWVMQVVDWVRTRRFKAKLAAKDAEVEAELRAIRELRERAYRRPHLWDLQAYPQLCLYCQQPRTMEVEAEECPQRSITNLS